MSVRRTVYRVMIYNAARMVWTVVSTHNEHPEAQEHAERWRHRGKRARVSRCTETSTMTIKPAVQSPTRQFRDQVAGRMIELADAKKRYKSPG